MVATCRLMVASDASGEVCMAVMMMMAVGYMPYSRISMRMRGNRRGRTESEGMMLPIRYAGDMGPPAPKAAGRSERQRRRKITYVLVSERGMMRASGRTQMTTYSPPDSTIRSRTFSIGVLVGCARQSLIVLRYSLNTLLSRRADHR